MKFDFNNIIKTTKQNDTKNALKDLKIIKKEIKKAARQGKSSVLIKGRSLTKKSDFYLDYFSLKGFKVRATYYEDLEIKWEFPIELPAYYIILEITEDSEPKIHALCNSEIKADRLKGILVDNATEDCFAVDPKVSGLDRKVDYTTVKKQCEKEFKIFKINDLNKLLKEEV